jgi:hypothetical protein
MNLVLGFITIWRIINQWEVIFLVMEEIQHHFTNNASDGLERSIKCKLKFSGEVIWGCFCYKTGRFKYGSHDFSKDDYKTYEEAQLECLKKLIEIIKEKK